MLTSTLLFASSAAAFSLPSLPDVNSILPLFARSTNIFPRKAASCPAVWSDVSKELTGKFLSNGQCNPDARAAIRLVFHDCGAWQTSLGATAGCDGSLILSGELERNENKGLGNISDYVQGLATKYNTGVADMIVFAGSHAIVTCPGGPQLKTWVGRKDSTTPAPPDLLPDVNAPAADLYKLFQDKGFSASDLAALLGAHTTSNQFNFNTTPGIAGQPQDSTPGVWDVKYYSETTNPPPGVCVLPSDAKLAVHPQVGKEFSGFVNNQAKWAGKFADAMGRMTLFGSGGTANLIDCTNALPKATNAKRELRVMNMFAPRH